MIVVWPHNVGISRTTKRWVGRMMVQSEIVRRTAPFMAVALMVLVGSASGRVASPRCPGSFQAAPLTTVSVFDGPLEEQADLVPSGGKRSKASSVSTWDVGYIYKAGRIVHLKCGYRTGVFIDVPVRGPVKRCTLIEQHGLRALACR